MEIVNDVLSIMQDAVWSELERDLVLHAVASRYSHEQLLHACQLLVDWIGWRADLEDVVQNLFEGQPRDHCHCRGETHEKNKGLWCHEDSEGSGKTKPHKSQNGSRVSFLVEDDKPKAPKSRIPVPKQPKNLRGGYSECPSEMFDGILVSDSESGTNRSEKVRFYSKTEYLSSPEECCCQDTRGRAAHSRLQGRFPVGCSSCKNSCRAVCEGDVFCCECSVIDVEDAAQVEVNETSSVPEGWVELKGRNVAIPPVTVKIWKLIKSFWDILPQFVCSRTCFGVPDEDQDRVKKEIRGINVLLEQVSLRLNWALPIVRKLQTHPNESGADLSLVDESLDEELVHLKTWIVRVYEECLIGELNIPELALPDTGLECESPLSESLYSDASQDTDMDYFDASNSFFEDTQDKNNNVEKLDNFNYPNNIVQDDLLSWLWQAVKSDMDDELMVHLVASHYTLQEVHQSRNILVSCGFSLPCMKGVRGLLLEIVGALRSVTDENNNNVVKKLPKFVCCNVSNRPSVRPVQWTSMERDLKGLSDMAQKLTTRICWLLPEAQRYSLAMETAKKCSLAPQLSATNDSLANLKTILDWELSTAPKAPADPHARSRHDSCSAFPSGFQSFDQECKEGKASLGKMQCWGVTSEGYPTEHWGGGWMWGGPSGVFPALTDLLPVPPPPPRPDVSDAMALQTTHLGRTFTPEPLHSPCT